MAAGGKSPGSVIRESFNPRLYRLQAYPMIFIETL